MDEPEHSRPNMTRDDKQAARQNAERLATGGILEHYQKALALDEQRHRTLQRQLAITSCMFVAAALIVIVARTQSALGPVLLLIGIGFGFAYAVREHQKGSGGSDRYW
jgi:hypothetical protein